MTPEQVTSVRGSQEGKSDWGWIALAQASLARGCWETPKIPNWAVQESNGTDCRTAAAAASAVRNVDSLKLLSSPSKRDATYGRES